MKYGNIKNDNYEFIIKTNYEDEFSHLLLVNGLYVKDGGTPIDFILNKIIPPLREKLIKKYPNLKPADIKNKMKIYLNMRFFKNLKFNAQAKEKITNNIKDFEEYFKDVDWNKIVRSLLRDEDLMNNITEYFKLKQKAKENAELKKLSKTKKKIKSDKYYPATKEKKYLALTEGLCLYENTEILTSNFDNKKIKDINIGDEILTPEYKKAKVKGKTKLLKETIKIKLKDSEIICTKEHRFFVYDTKEKRFKVIEAKEFITDKDRFKMLKSKVNKDTILTKITNIDFDNKIIYTTGDKIIFTENDYFGIIRNNEVLKVKWNELKIDDFIIFHKI